MSESGPPIADPAGDVALVATGAANLASVTAAFARLGRTCRVVDDPADLLAAEHAVLPGVGAFGPAIDGLRQRGLDQALRQRVEAGRPLLAVCLGLQLLFEGSEESPDAQGLGLLPGRVRRFAPSLRVPQMGWSPVTTSGGPLLHEGWAYYANSYRVADADLAGLQGVACSTSEHGGPFLAALERGPLLACQFHPELSGSWGSDLLRRWLEAPCPPAA